MSERSEKRPKRLVNPKLAREMQAPRDNLAARQQPRCPSCRWYLAVVSEDKSWVARCRNGDCPVGVVPPTLNQSLLAFVCAEGPVASTVVAEQFEWSVPNANNHLTTLLRLNLVSRRRSDPILGGKRFAWSCP